MALWVRPAVDVPVDVPTLTPNISDNREPDVLGVRTAKPGLPVLRPESDLVTKGDTPDLSSEDR